jgi:hypothetical protein
LVVELVPRPLQFTSRKKNVGVTMEFEVSNKRILRLMLSNDMVQWVLQWERQKRCSCRKRQGPMAKKCYYNKLIMIFFRGREDEDKIMVKHDFFFKMANFWTYIRRKKSTHSLFGPWSFLLIHIRFTPSEGPNGFVIGFFFGRSWTIEVGPHKLDHGKGHLPWSDFTVHDVTWPSV